MYFGTVAGEHNQLRRRFLILYSDFLWIDFNFTIYTFMWIFQESECYKYMIVQCFASHISYQVQLIKMSEPDLPSLKLRAEKAMVKHMTLFLAPTPLCYEPQ
ncbi:hypothetical protein O6H91_Y332900 [Diphasiastrum complanatum]|nr:hypothetical protein O6H91_Y332900 [Diphasiastrum complanatum]